MEQTEKIYPASPLVEIALQARPRRIVPDAIDGIVVGSLPSPERKQGNCTVQGLRSLLALWLLHNMHRLHVLEGHDEDDMYVSRFR